MLPAPKNNIADPKTGTVTVEWLSWLQDLADDRAGGAATAPPNTPPLAEPPAADATIIVNDYGAGTPGVLAKWLAPQTLGDSILTEDNGVVTVHGTLIATTLQGRYDSAATARQQPRVFSIASVSPSVPDVDHYDFYDLTALAVGATFNNPTGTPVNAQRFTIRIKDNGTARAIAWGTAYVAGGALLPSTTIAGKILTLEFIYNTANALNKWQCVVRSQEA